MTPKIPKPFRVGRFRRWWLSQLKQYEAELSGLPPDPVDPAEDRMISAQEVCKRWGVGEQTLWRRLREQEAEASAQAGALNHSDNEVWK